MLLSDFGGWISTCIWGTLKRPASENELTEFSERDPEKEKKKKNNPEFFLKTASEIFPVHPKI